jgi:hypothetical protein
MSRQSSSFIVLQVTIECCHFIEEAIECPRCYLVRLRQAGVGIREVK